MKSIIILKDSFDGGDTIAYADKDLNGHVMFAGEFMDLKADFVTKKGVERYELPDSEYKRILNAIKKGLSDSEDSDELASFAYNYCNKVENLELMQQILLDSKNSELITKHANAYTINKGSKDAVLKNTTPEQALEYLKKNGRNPDYENIILTAADGRGRNNKIASLARSFCTNVENTPQMRQLILDSSVAPEIELYLLYVQCDEEGIMALADAVRKRMRDHSYIARNFLSATLDKEEECQGKFKGREHEFPTEEQRDVIRQVLIDSQDTHCALSVCFSAKLKGLPPDPKLREMIANEWVEEDVEEYLRIIDENDEDMKKALERIRGYYRKDGCYAV